VIDGENEGDDCDEGVRDGRTGTNA